VFLISLNQDLRRNLDSKIDYPIAVVAEDDLHQVLPNIMHIALHRRQNDLAARSALGLLHELLEMAHARLHRFRRLQNFGNDQLVVVE